MGLQVMRTTPIPLQFHLPEGKLTEALDSLPGAVRSILGFEGVAVDAGRGIIVRFLLRARGLSPAVNVQLADRLLSTVGALGGRPYATGAFFRDKAAWIYGADRLRRLKEFAAVQDPAGLLNPGRAF
jgi:hypothetical protein